MCRKEKQTLAEGTVLVRDTNKIRFNFQRSAFIVHYTAADGRMKQVSKGLEVPRGDALGRFYSPKDYAAVKASVLNKARKTWDKLDETGVAGFFEPDLIARCGDGSV